MHRSHVSILSCLVCFLFAVQIAGRPSLELSKKMTEEEKQRVSEQCKTLGEEGLKEKEKILEEALLANEVWVQMVVYRCYVRNEGLVRDCPLYRRSLLRTSQVIFLCQMHRA